jgi:hypothetical protein
MAAVQGSIGASVKTSASAKVLATKPDLFIVKVG